MRVLSNCLLAALVAKIRHPFSTRIVRHRNPAGRWHYQWLRDGRLYEFYAPGRSRKSYLQNALYLGVVREVENIHIYRLVGDV